MMSFTHNLIDPDLPYCPLCGELYCTCDDVDDENDDYEDQDYDSEYGTCGCPFCFCGNRTLAGGVCNNCLCGEHQG